MGRAVGFEVAAHWTLVVLGVSQPEGADMKCYQVKVCTSALYAHLELEFCTTLVTVGF